MPHNLPDGYTLTPPAHAQGVAAPGGWTTYSNPPSESIDARGRVFRGLLAFDRAGQLRYIVFLPEESSRLVWESAANVGSGSLTQNPFYPLRVVLNTAQGKNTPTDDFVVKEFEPLPLPAGVGAGAGVVLHVDSPAWAVWDGTYAGKNLDTSEEIAASLNKLKAGFLALRDAVVRRG